MVVTLVIIGGGQNDGFAAFLLGTRTYIVIAISGRGLRSWLITEASIIYLCGEFSTMGAQQRVLIVGFHVDVGTTVLLMRENACDFQFFKWL